MSVIGIAGLGSIGTRHARVFGALPDVRLVVHDLAGVDSSVLPPDCIVAPTIGALLNAGLDGLVVAVPDSAHADTAAAACARGIPVLLEKPIADTLANGRRIVAAADASGTPVLVGYVLRHVGCMQRAYTLLGDGVVGTPISFHLMLGAYETLQVARNRFSHDEFGALFRDYSHEWDYLRWLIAPVSGGFALARRAGSKPLQQDPNVVDAVLRLVDGTTGTVHLDYVQEPGIRRFTITGDAGRLEVDVTAGTIRVHRTNQTDLVEDHAEPRDRAFGAQAAHFLAVAGRTVSAAADVHDGLAALEVADALQRSAVQARWIDLAGR